jgi:hypothetical protein
MSDTELAHVMPEMFLDVSAPMRVDRLEFGLLSGDDMRRLAEVTMQRRDLYEHSAEQKPAEYGPLDRRLGTVTNLSRSVASSLITPVVART